MKLYKTVKENNCCEIIDFQDIYGWMRVERNRLWVMYGPALASCGGTKEWRSDEIFDFEVSWKNLCELSEERYLVPGYNEVFVLNKSQLLNSPQKIFHWKTNEVRLVKPWREIVYYAKTKHYFIEKRLDSYKTKCK